jgi:hypothetical protein
MVCSGAKKKKMKMSILSALGRSVLMFLVPAAVRADDVPKRFNFDRYQVMLDRSPFAVASAVALPAATADFAKDLYVANAAKSPDGDMVTIASGFDKNFKKYLSTKEAVDGYSIANIEWSDKVGATKVTISKDGKFATLTFNQALLAQPVANAPAPPQQPPATTMQQGTAGSPQTAFPKPAPVPSLPNSRVRGVIQRNPNVPQNPNAAPKPDTPDS